MTRDPALVVAKAIGNVFIYAAILKDTAARNPWNIDGHRRIIKASECLLRGCRDAARAMGTQPSWSTVDMLATRGHVKATQQQVKDLLERIANRKEQGR